MMSFFDDKMEPTIYFNLDFEGYASAQASSLCKVHKDIEGRAGCNSDSDCFKKAKMICDDDPSCLGISWNPCRIEQPLKICLSTDTETNAEWRTMKKLKKGILQFKRIIKCSPDKHSEGY